MSRDFRFGRQTRRWILIGAGVLTSWCYFLIQGSHAGTHCSVVRTVSRSAFPFRHNLKLCGEVPSIHKIEASLLFTTDRCKKGRLKQSPLYFLPREVDPRSCRGTCQWSFLVEPKNT